MNKTRRLAVIAVMAALASVLHAVEALIPIPYVVPGAKLGLANIVALFLVMDGTLAEALSVNFMRTLLGSLLSGTFLGVGYFLSLSGAIFSTFVMAGAKNLLKGDVTVVGISVVGAVTHNFAQLLTASLFLNQIGVLFYLPYLLFFAIPTGVFVGMVTRRLLVYAKRAFGTR